MSRREKIESMLAEDPNDTFLRYSLAMEYRSEGNVSESLRILDALIGDHPPCVAAFFMAAQQLSEKGEIEEGNPGEFFLVRTFFGRIKI